MAERTWSPDVVGIGDRIAALSAAAAAELGRYLELVHGIRADSLPKRLPDPNPDLVIKPVVPEPTEFDVALDGFDPARKINVIKAVREQTSLGLKEALNLVTAVPAVVQRR